MLRPIAPNRVKFEFGVLPDRRARFLRQLSRRNARSSLESHRPFDFEGTLSFSGPQLGTRYWEVRRIVVKDQS
jgi:hypothetical protein